MFNDSECTYLELKLYYIILVMKMALRESLLVFAMLWSMSCALRCYKCRPNRDEYRFAELCEHFNYSDKFITECAVSTMCYKREITSSLGNGIKLYERDCARQVMSDYQEIINNTWTRVNKIREVYEVGCEESSRDEKVTTTVNCYCRGDLCNKALVRRSGGVMMLIGPLFLKYLLQ